MDAEVDALTAGSNHGTMFRFAARDGCVAPERSIQIGVRTPDPDTCGSHTLDLAHVLGRGRRAAGAAGA